jgi:hypothetical protein
MHTVDTRDRNKSIVFDPSSFVQDKRSNRRGTTWIQMINTLVLY